MYKLGDGDGALLDLGLGRKRRSGRQIGACGLELDALNQVDCRSVDLPRASGRPRLGGPTDRVSDIGHRALVVRRQLSHKRGRRSPFGGLRQEYTVHHLRRNVAM
jgi:hypothetical protein